jgi:hypothetical protein
MLRRSAANNFRLSLYCTVHKAFSIAKAQFDACPRFISSMIGYAIAQRPAGSLDTLRECAACFFKARLRIVRTALPPVADREARAEFLSWVLGGNGPECRRRRQCVDSFLNGNWAVPTPEHYHVFGCPCRCTSEQEFATYITDTLVPSLMPGMVRLFPRHRWTGSDQTLSDLALMSAPHQLMSQITPIWLTCIRSHRDPTVEDRQILAMLVSL